MSERYTELIDAAQVQQDKTNKAAVEAVQQQEQVDNTDPDFDGKHCVDGGEVIPKGRLALGKIRCVYCQELLERNRSTYRRF